MFGVRAVKRFEKAGNQDAGAQSKEKSLDLFFAHALTLLRSGPQAVKPTN